MVIPAGNTGLNYNDLYYYFSLLYKIKFQLFKLKYIVTSNIQQQQSCRTKITKVSNTIILHFILIFVTELTYCCMEKNKKSVNK